MSKFIEERKCKFCKSVFLPHKHNHIYCDGCKEKRIKKIRLTGITTNTVGAISELFVSADLLKKGYEVFRAVSPSCSCDLIILKNGIPFRVEVRTAYRLINGNISLSRGKKADILAIVVHHEEEIIYEPNLP